jgi:hypothetical protein
LVEGDELFAVEIGGGIPLSPCNPDFEKVMDAARYFRVFYHFTHNGSEWMASRAQQ